MSIVLSSSAARRISRVVRTVESTRVTSDPRYAYKPSGFGMPFSGAVERAGEWFFDLNQHPEYRFVVVPDDGREPFETDDEMPVPNPINETWYRKAYTSGDIHHRTNR